MSTRELQLQAVQLVQLVEKLTPQLSALEVITSSLKPRQETPPQTPLKVVLATDEIAFDEPRQASSMSKNIGQTPKLSQKSSKKSSEKRSDSLFKVSVSQWEAVTAAAAQDTPSKVKVKQRKPRDGNKRDPGGL